MPPAAPRVFLSYSHDSPQHVDRVLALADRLRAWHELIDRPPQPPVTSLRETAGSPPR